MTDEAKLVVKALRWCADVDKDECGCSGCPREYEDAGPYCRDDLDVCAADLIEELDRRNQTQELILVGVMHFVDKWLDGVEPYSSVDDPTGQIATDRATEARKLTLEHIERLEAERNVLKARCEAAEKDMEFLLSEGSAGCDMCAYFNAPSCTKRAESTYCEPKWRGPQENGAPFDEPMGGAEDGD